MDTLKKLIEISDRLDHLENSAEWITRQTVHSDNTVSQTGTLICVLAEDIREKVNELARTVEEIR